MKTVKVTRANGDELTITAPDGKTMAVDAGLLAHGILSLGEYGPSGIKVAAFNDWCVATFASEDDGYTFELNNPF